jgi:hypothetical protein
MHPEMVAEPTPTPDNRRRAFITVRGSVVVTASIRPPLGGLVLVLLAGCAEPPKPEPPPAVRAAECRRVAGDIKLDGQPDEAAWSKAQLLTDFAVFWQNRKPATATKARLLWDDSHLYFAGEMDDADLYADVTQFNGRAWDNDVFELFFKPSTEKLSYHEFQVNAANTKLELNLPSRGSGGYNRFAPALKLGLVESQVKLRGTLNQWQDRDAGWSVEGRIPWEAFAISGGRPKPGAVWKFALCRYDYSVAFEQPELSSSAPLTQANFHRYEDYGDLKFVGP